MKQTGGKTNQMETKNKPWARQKILKKQDIPSQETIYNMALEFKNHSHRTLFIIAYLTAGRISEIVRQPNLKKNKYKMEEAKDKYGRVVWRVVRNEQGSPIIDSVERYTHGYIGICRKNITFEKKRGHNFIVISMQNRKNKNFTNKKIPIPVDQEGHLVELIKEHLGTLEMDQPIFNFGISWAERIIAKVGMNPHFLRDIRLTHLVTMYDFDGFRLAKYAGWKNSVPAERYVRLGYHDLLDKFNQ